MTIKIMTYNIRRLGDEEISINQWKFRSKYLIDVIKKNGPDILCVQEDSLPQIKEIKNNLINSDSFGFYNEEENSNVSGEANTIFFNIEKLKLLEKRFFWLTDTPNEKSKLEKQSLHHRTVTYVLLKDSNDKEVSIFNTHFDHLSEEVQEKEAIFLLKLISEINPKNYIICGDFNGDIGSQQIELLKKEFKLANKNTKKKTTVVGWSESRSSKRCVDFIFSNFPVRTVKIDDSTYLAQDNKERTPSDHSPVLCELEM